MNQFSREGRKSIILAVRPPVFDHDIPALNVAQVAESETHGLDLTRVAGSRGDSKQSHTRHLSGDGLGV
jgi:hypothetical protein